jgi:hypothetical protein
MTSLFLLNTHFLTAHGSYSGMMWISSHVGVRGNKRADKLAGDAVENDIEWLAPVRPFDFLPLSGVRLLEG